MNKSKFIWLFGENMGNTANNNSFYFWRHIVEKNDEIEKYFIMKKNKKNLKAYKSLSRKEKCCVERFNKTLYSFCQSRYAICFIKL